MRGRYREIDKGILKTAYKKAWSIENMAGHEAEDRKVEYIGSTRDGNLIRDYYLDKEGHYWYENKRNIDGKTVSMDVYLFGHEIKKKRKKKS